MKKDAFFGILSVVVICVALVVEGLVTGDIIALGQGAGKFQRDLSDAPEEFWGFVSLYTAGALVLATALILNRRGKFSEVLPPVVFPAVVIAASIAAVLVFILQTRPHWSEFTLPVLGVAALFVVVFGGLILLALGKSGAQVTSPETDKQIREKYAHSWKRLRFFGVAGVGVCLLAYAGYLLWAGHFPTK